MVVVIKEEESEPDDQVPRRPKNQKEFCLLDSSEASYLQICLAGLGAYPLPAMTRKLKDDQRSD